MPEAVPLGTNLSVELKRIVVDRARGFVFDALVKCGTTKTWLGHVIQWKVGWNANTMLYLLCGGINSLWGEEIQHSTFVILPKQTPRVPWGSIFSQWELVKCDIVCHRASVSLVSLLSTQGQLSRVELVANSELQESISNHNLVSAMTKHENNPNSKWSEPGARTRARNVTIESILVDLHCVSVYASPRPAPLNRHRQSAFPTLIAPMPVNTSRMDGSRVEARVITMRSILGWLRILLIKEASLFANNPLFQA